MKYQIQKNRDLYWIAFNGYCYSSYTQIRNSVYQDATNTHVGFSLALSTIWNLPLHRSCDI